LNLLLSRGNFEALWPVTWSSIVEFDELPKLAFERSAHELAEASNALSRALVATLQNAAAARGQAGPSRELRLKLVGRLLDDWGQSVFAVGPFLTNLFKRAATHVLRRHRNQYTDVAVLPIGDILLYQSRGAEVRNYIRTKIESASPPVTVVAHSLGGVASVDLLAMPGAPQVAHLITCGSQSPFFFEIGALVSMMQPTPLPEDFPRWLNIYDRNDFLSYVARRLFPHVEDFEARSGLPFPDSHAAYFTNEQVWTKIKQFGVP
jgi:hypothetical protein